MDRRQRKLEQNFGVIVRRRRNRLKLSQEDLAEAASVHRTYISDVELGKVSVGVGVAKRLASALKTSLAELVWEAEKS